jgi:hypothetical protein
LLTTLRSGIPPSQAGRGLQYLIQTVAFPGQQTAASRQALASVGITPTANLTLQQRLGHIFGRARRLGMTGDLNRLRNLDEETLNSLDAMGDTTGGLQQLGISGRGAAFLGTIFRRIHALRTALAIQQQVDTGQAQEDLRIMTDAMQGHVSDVDSLKKGWQRLEKQAKLKEASIALNAMGLQIAQMFAPVLNFAAGKITGLQSLMARHPQASRYTALGGGAFLAALGIGRALNLGQLRWLRGIPGLSRLLTRGGGGGGLGRAFVTANAVQAAMAGNAALGASPQNPLYVVVVGQLFGGGTAGPGGVGGGGGGGTTVVPWWSRGIRAIGRGARAAAGGALRYGGRLGGPALGEISAATMAGAGVFGAGLAFAQRGETGDIRWSPTGRPYIDFGNRISPVPGGRRQEHMAELRQAQRVFQQYGNIGNIENYRVGQLRGRAEVFMTLDISRDGKSQRIKVHSPMELWANGRTPSTRAKQGSRRG